VRLLLDTAVLIFAVQAPERMSRIAAEGLSSPENIREVSSISLTEIAIKMSLGKLRFTSQMAHQALVDLDLHILPYNAAHAFHYFDLPLHHTDPFDRQIIAQALCEKIAVVTPDDKFGLYDGLEILW
jgi:PIN domain nuclease of toxin-antitoxin system